MKQVLLILLFQCSSWATTYYEWSDGRTCTAEKIGGTVYYDFDDGNYMTSTTIHAQENSAYKKYLTYGLSSHIVKKDEFRNWKDNKGNKKTAKFINKIGENALLELKNGKRITVPVKKLSELDNQYIREMSLPSLSLDVGKKTYNTSRSYQRIAFTLRVKYESLYEFPLPLNMHFFVFSKSNELIRHEHEEDIQFIDSKYEFIMSSVTFTQSVEKRRNTQYGGYLLMITDAKHRLVEIECTNKKALEKIEKLENYGIRKIQLDGRLPFVERNPYAPNSRL